MAEEEGRKSVIAVYFFYFIIYTYIYLVAALA